MRQFFSAVEDVAFGIPRADERVTHGNQIRRFQNNCVLSQIDQGCQVSYTTKGKALAQAKQIACLTGLGLQIERFGQAACWTQTRGKSFRSAKGGIGL